MSFQWKVAGRSTGSKRDSSAITMFVEPALPWCVEIRISPKLYYCSKLTAFIWCLRSVRHPRSRFTAMWESIQAVLLIYVAFNVVWRISFNAQATGMIFLFEIAIDIYFTVDVILNCNTAFYDESGDLIGVNSKGKADRSVLLKHYASGWMVIDVVSVLPFQYIGMISADESMENTGEQLKVLKTLRLLRLLKLLRLARGVKIFKKHEDKLVSNINIIS